MYDEYTDKVIEHFMSPRNVGSMPDADGEGRFGDPDCGDSLTLYVNQLSCDAFVNKGGRIPAPIHSFKN
jgi:NifU-like protein involved in Fe-S cluster formation